MNESFLKIKSNDVKCNLVNLSQFVFEVTDSCNLRCKYCGYGELSIHEKSYYEKKHSFYDIDYSNIIC